MSLTVEIKYETVTYLINKCGKMWCMCIYAEAAQILHFITVGLAYYACVYVLYVL